MGITVRFVDVNDPAAFVAAMDDKTRCFFCETVSNPALEIADLEEISKLAHENGLPLVVDSTFSTPYLCKPFEFGADIVCSSLTKWVGGHGTGVGGIVVDNSVVSGNINWGAGKHPNFDEPDSSYGGLRWGHDLPEGLAPLAFRLRLLTVPLRNLGGCISPDNSWMFLQGIETLSLRMERHCSNTLAVAEYMEQHDDVAWVRYPGLKADPMFSLNEKYLKGKGGSLLVFGLKSDDGKKAGQQFIDSLSLISHVANVGSCQSLAIHPASTTHSQMNPEQQLAAGVKPEMIRLSIGIETVADIIADIEKGIQASKA